MTHKQNAVRHTSRRSNSALLSLVKPVATPSVTALMARFIADDKLKRFGKPDGIEVKSVAHDPEEDYMRFLAGMLFTSFYLLFAIYLLHGATHDAVVGPKFSTQAQLETQCDTERKGRKDRTYDYAEVRR